MARIQWFLCWAVAALIQPVCLIVMFTGTPKGGQLSHVRVVAAKAQLNALSQALNHYKADVGEYPPDQFGLQALMYDPGVPNWQGPYLFAGVLLDPWNHPYLYRHRGRNMPEVLCFGADGQHGGYRFNADISNLSGSGDLYRSGAGAWRDILSWLPLTGAMIGFFGYPFLPAMLRMLNRRFAR